MPFITEEIWQKVAPLAGTAGETIMLQPYPLADESKINKQAMAQMQWVMQAITGIRNIRGEMNIKPSQKIPVLFDNAGKQDRQFLEQARGYFDFLAKTESITCLEETESAPEAATALVGDMKVLVPLAGLIDKGAELKRLDKEIERLDKEIGKAKGKLGNSSFVDKAPAQVVEQEKTRLAEFQSALANLKEQYSRIEALPD